MFTLNSRDLRMWFSIISSRMVSVQERDGQVASGSASLPGRMCLRLLTYKHGRDDLLHTSSLLPGWAGGPAVGVVKPVCGKDEECVADQSSIRIDGLKTKPGILRGGQVLLAVVHE